MYAVVRRDLEMPPGKLAAQAGHAFLGAFLLSQQQPSPAFRRYKELSPGTKIVLEARDRKHLVACQARLEADGMSVYRVVDQGHVLPPHFDASPICTAIGFGPTSRREVSDVVDDIALVP